jgi:hypothetical protein
VRTDKLRAAAKSLLAYQPTMNEDLLESEINDLVRRLSRFVSALNRTGLQILEKQVSRVHKARMPPSAFYAAMTKLREMSERKDKPEHPSEVGEDQWRDQFFADSASRGSPATPNMKCFRFTKADSKDSYFPLRSDKSGHRPLLTPLRNVDDKRRCLLFSLFGGEVIFYILDESQGSLTPDQPGLTQTDWKIIDSGRMATLKLMQFERKNHFTGSVLMLACAELNTAKTPDALAWHHELQMSIAAHGLKQVLTAIQETVEALLDSLKGSSVRKRPRPKPRRIASPGTPRNASSSPGSEQTSRSHDHKHVASRSSGRRGKTEAWL